MADIRNYNSNSLISGTSGNDYIGNYNSNVTLNGGNGDDTVWNASFNILISGGAGNDSINNEGSEYVTINGGKGNDSIQNNFSSNTVFKYTSGDGNDIIQGFRADSTLKILDSSYSVKNNGYDIIVTVGKGKITLTGAASLSQVNIEGKEIYNPSDAKIIKLTAGNDTYKNFIEGVTIQAFGGNDSIYNSSPNVSINVGDGGDSVRNESSSVTIVGETGNDKIENAYGGKNSSINCGAGDDTVWNGGSSNVTINCGAGNDSAEVYGENISISGGAGNDKINLFDGAGYSDVTVNGSKGYDYIYNYSSSVTIEGGKGDDTIENRGTNVTMNGGDGDDVIQNHYNYYDGAVKVISISGGAGNDSLYNHRGTNVTMSGGDGNDSIFNLRGDSVTIDGGVGNDSIYNGRWLDDHHGSYNAGGSNVTINGGAGDDSIYNIDGSSVTIDGGAGNDSIENYGSNVTIDGGKGYDYIFNKGSSITIDGGKGNDSIYNNWYFSENRPYTNYDGSNVLFKYAEGDGNDKIYGFFEDSTLSISGGSYSTTQSGDDVIVTVGKGKISLIGAMGLSYININGKKIVPETNSWKLNGTTAKYGTSKKTLVTVKGVKSLDGISLSDKVITLSASALKQNKVTVSKGYKLAFDYDVNTNKETSTAWSYSNSTATYRQTTSAYYALASDKKSVIYKAASNKTLATVKGVNSADGLFVNGKVITIGANSLGKSKVTVSDGYKLALDYDVNTNKETSTAWSYSNLTATYKQTNSEYYSLASDKKSVIYKAASNKTLATVKGVKSADGLSVNGKVITIGADSLGKSKVTVSDGYKLALDYDVNTDKETSTAWSYSNSTATYKQTNSEYYALSSNKKSVIYKAASNKTLATVKGVNSAYGLSVSGKKIIVSASALNKSKVTISGDGYKLALASDVTKSTSTKKVWSCKNSVATYSQTATAGYSLASDSKSISYSTGTNQTLAMIKGVKSADGITVSDKIIKVSKNALGSSKKVTVKGNDYEFNFATGNISITGSGNADKITSNGSDVSIYGGAGNDSVSLGANAANNVIQYATGDGDDTVINYSEDDTIRIESGEAKVSTSGNDVIFTVDNGSITVKDAKNKIISYSDSNGDKIYSTVPATPYKVSKDGKTVTIYTSYDKKDFDVTETVTGGDKIETIDASAVNYGINIIGNEKSNKIIGGSGNDTLEGDNGNDTLVGGDGADVFLYYGGYGNDIISDYAESDIISIASGNISKVKPNGKDVIFTVGKNKITVKNALRKGITYIDKNDVEHDYKNGEQTVKINDTKTTATISEDYWKKTFDVANFGKKIRIIDATPVTNDIKITGNDKANQILGGSGKNTLAGGAGNDTLQGNDKEDIFVYNKGDGDDIIYDYSEGDKISIVSGIVNNVSVKGDTVILTVGDGRISVYGAAGKTRITYRDENGEKTKIYSKETSNSNVVESLWFAEDDTNYELTPNLSSIVQNNSADYSFAKTSTEFGKETNLIAYSGKK